MGRRHPRSRRHGRQHRLTDEQREVIQIAKTAGLNLSIAQLARAMECHKSTVVYWRKTRIDDTGRLVFVRPKGVYAGGR